jgi:hypothetical protein
MLDEEQAGCDHVEGEGGVAVAGDALDGAAEIIAQALKLAISDTPISRARMPTYTETGVAVPRPRGEAVSGGRPPGPPPHLC